MPKAIQKNEEEVKNEVNNEMQEDNREVIKEIVKEEEKENFTKIYIGTTILAYNLAENTIFIDSFPENINKAIENDKNKKEEFYYNYDKQSFENLIKLFQEEC